MAKIHVTTTINGDEVEFLCDPEQTLLDVLRDELQLTGSKEGCASGDCGACSVMLDGRLVCACLVLGVEAEGQAVETIEGMAKGDRAAPAAAEVPRARGAAVRRLHAGLPDRRQGAARARPRPERDRGALLARRQPLPLHRLRQDRARRARRRCRDERELTHGNRAQERDRRAGARRRPQMDRHPADPPRRRRQGHRPRQVRRRPDPARHAGRQGPAQPAAARPDQVDRHREGGGAARGQGGRHRATTSRTCRRSSCRRARC